MELAKLGHNGAQRPKIVRNLAALLYKDFSVFPSQVSPICGYKMREPRKQPLDARRDMS